jgi:hypothetical protein
LVGYLLVLGSGHTYTARATLYVAPPTSSSPTDALMGDQYAANRTQLYLELAKSDELAKRVAAQIHSTQPPSELASRITVKGSHDAPVLTIDAKGPSPQQARDLAQGYLQQFPDYARAVEQGSGVREGPVLIPVGSPQQLSGPISGWRPWMAVALPAVALGAVAFALVAWQRNRHPRARDVKALRRAINTSFVERVRSDPRSLQRIQAMLFAGPHCSRTVIFASARKGDGLDRLSAVFAAFLDNADIPHRRVAADHALDIADSPDIVVIDAPALLDESYRIAALAAYTQTAVIVANSRGSLVEDVVELARLFELNGIGVKGVIVASRRLPKPLSRKPSEHTADSRRPETPWPSIDVLEEAGIPRRHGKVSQ